MKNLQRKTHIGNMVLPPYLYEIFSGFLNISLCEEGNSEILHDEFIFWSDIESPLKQYDAFLDITQHCVGPAEISENFWIIRGSDIGSLKK